MFGIFFLNTFNQYTCYSVCMYNVIITFFKMLIVSIYKHENHWLLYRVQFSTYIKPQSFNLTKTIQIT